MGAQAFAHTVLAMTPKAGFDELVKRARYEYGTALYNGTISTCSMGCCTKKFEQATQENVRQAWNFVEEQDYGEKWVADYIDIGPKDERAKEHVYLFYGWASC